MAVISKYQAVLDNIRKERCSIIVKELYEAAGITLPGINKRCDTEEQCARAVLIWLAISTFDISIKSDIVLCALGLLDGYSEIQGVQQRREKFFIDSNYAFKVGKKLVYAADLSDDQLDYQARQFNKTDGPLLHELIEYFKGLQDKVTFYREACERYLEIPTAGYPFRVAKLPRPSYELAFDKPVRYIKRIKNADFCGRDDILKALEDGFSSKRERKVQVLHGMAGVGKTQIALAYAYSHQDEYSAILWIDATDYSTLNRECLNFLRENDDYSVEKPTIGEIRVRFLSFLSRRSSLLLILDNVDYLDGRTDSAYQMKERLLRYIPDGNGHAIITTRCDSDFSGAARISVSVFSPELASHFLEKQAGQKADDAAKLLAKRLGYLPLALTYAVAYIKANHKTYQQYLDLWDREGAAVFDEDILETTVRNAFHITLDKLSEDTDGVPVITQFLHFCAVLAGEYIPIDFLNNDFNKRNNDELFPEELNAILNNELKRDRILRKASEYSLIEYIDGGRISMHPLLREIIEDELRRDRDSNDLKEQIEAFRWKRIGYFIKSELAYAYYKNGDIDTANQQMRFVISDFLEMEQELLQLNGKVTPENSIKATSWLVMWSRTRQEFDRIYWRTMEFANDSLAKEMFDTRRRLMQAFYLVGLGNAAHPDFCDYYFLIEASKRGYTFDSDPNAPIVLSYEDWKENDP